MSGLRKAKKYDWKDSNMALFGSDTEKKVKKESAESEPAWQGCGQTVGVKIWRIVKFKVESWPEEDYGKFFEGDSYIILNTYKEEDELKYDVHFWIGKYSTQDEYGTAAYKTVELDTFLDDKPIQHREVQGHESQAFKSYFKNLTYLKGGAETGFNRVTPQEYNPRLMKFRKEGSRTQMTDVARNRDQLDDGDVYILDLGLELIQWNGQNCVRAEKFAAAQMVQNIKSERGGKPVVTILEQADISDNHKFYDALDEDPDDEEQDAEDDGETVLTKVSDDDGSIGMDPVKEGNVTKDDLSSDDVFLIDTRKAMYVWIGSGASVDERRNAIPYAHSYLKDTNRPFLSITVVKEGQENNEFKNAVAGCA